MRVCFPFARDGSTVFSPVFYFFLFHPRLQDEVQVLRTGEHFILPASIVLEPDAQTRRTWPQAEQELVRQALVETLTALCAKEAATGGFVTLALANVSRCDHLTWRSWADNKVSA